MDRFGIDLGTTNSAVCYYNPEKKAYQFLTIGTQTLDFFPTMIAYRKEDDSVRYIGEKAKKYRNSKNYDVYSMFKLSLGEGAREKNGRSKSPYEVTRDFLDEVIKAFKEVTGQENLNNLVLTVPDVWKNEDKGEAAMEHLMQIFEELGWDAEARIALESEPVSAAAYYCRAVCKTPYRGYVLVVDYGGGTLDLTICRVEEDGTITVLRRCGDGGRDGIGCAGAAFDTALTERLVAKYQKEYDMDPKKYAPGMPRFRALRDAMENAKISSTRETTQALQMYYRNQVDSCAFTVPVEDEDGEMTELKLMASDVAETFESVNGPSLKTALNTMLEYCRDLEIDWESQDQFRVLMVGGFSNLYCVEAACREAFGAMDDQKDMRFDQRMRQFGRCSSAIAHGAGLIAEGVARIEYHCQSDIGYYYYDACSESEKTAVVIQRNTPVTDYKEPRYFGGRFKLDGLAKGVGIRLYFNDGSGPVPVTMDESFRNLCPNVDLPDNTYRIGFSMGRHRVPVLHIKDDSGAVRSHSLNEIISKIALRMAQETGEP